MRASKPLPSLKEDDIIELVTHYIENDGRVKIKFLDENGRIRPGFQAIIYALDIHKTLTLRKKTADDFAASGVRWR